MKTNIENTLAKLRRASMRYVRYENYYKGKHYLAFATEKFENAFGSMFREFALNLCPAVCDAFRDKLRLCGFGIDRGGDISDVIDSIWRHSAMQTRAGEIHKEALKNGDAYVIVWPDKNGKATIYLNRSANCSIEIDEEDQGKIKSAAKVWQASDGHFRLNVFYCDRIEKFVTSKPAQALPADANSFVPLADDAVIENPFGIVPVFHFANNADLGEHGVSELEPVIPIQDGLNKAVLDMMVAMEFSAFRQRWAAGIEIEFDGDGKPVPPFDSGIDHLWITENPTAKFGDFNTADLEQFLRVKDSFRVDIACVTGVPLHYLQPDLAGFPSGEALRRAESRFLGKIRSRQENFGRVWQEILQFALLIDGYGADNRLVAQWEDPAPLSDREILENTRLKLDLGIRPEKALADAGFGLQDLTTNT